MRPSRTKRGLTPQLPYTRMSLRSYRNVALVPMESSSSSSSDDSCDSFGSDGFANTKKSVKQPKVTKVVRGPAEDKAQSASEDREFSKGMEAMKVDSDSEASGPQRRTRRSHILKVALKFPVRKASEPKPTVKPLPRHGGSEPDSDEGENFMDKRALNIKENKAMLAKLMAELNKVPGLFPRRPSSLSADSPRRVPRRSLEAAGPCRRNPERVSRPHTRSRSAVDGPPSPVREDPEDRFTLVRRSRFYEEDDEPGEPRRRGYQGALAIPHVVRPVSEVTQEELNNICFTVRDKVYNRCTVSVPPPPPRDLYPAAGCSFSPGLLLPVYKLVVSFPGLHMPSVPPKDHRHKDQLPQPRVCRGPRSVLRAMPTQPLWRGGPRRPAGPGLAVPPLQGHMQLQLLPGPRGSLCYGRPGLPGEVPRL
uniref:Cell division cycle associated 7a n=1 Tax=Paramormyrops kingsleyae TaxID=1676925 RepID=A0A3B3QPN1_9TELE